MKPGRAGSRPGDVDRDRGSEPASISAEGTAKTEDNPAAPARTRQPRQGTKEGARSRGRAAAGGRHAHDETTAAALGVETFPLFGPMAAWLWKCGDSLVTIDEFCKIEYGRMIVKPLYTGKGNSVGFAIVRPANAMPDGELRCVDLRELGPGQVDDLAVTLTSSERVELCLAWLIEQRGIFPAAGTC